MPKAILYSAAILYCTIIERVASFCRLRLVATYRDKKIRLPHGTLISRLLLVEYLFCLYWKVTYEKVFCLPCIMLVLNVDVLNFEKCSKDIVLSMNLLSSIAKLIISFNLSICLILCLTTHFVYFVLIIAI
jgi:hypothetical protein